MASTGRYSLDDIEATAADELAVGDVFIHQGRAWKAVAVYPENLSATAIPWAGGDPRQLRFMPGDEVALMV